MVTGAKKGRPPARKRKAGERVPLGLRVTTDLKRDLDSAAAASGRSQSQEAEFRLENSFTLLNDPRFANFFAVLSGAFGMLLDEEQKSGWRQRDYEYRLLTLALARVLNEVAPDFYRLKFEVGDANSGPEKTYTEFANRHVENMDKQRESFRASGTVGDEE